MCVFFCSFSFSICEHCEHVKHFEGYYVFNYPCDEPQNDQNIIDLRLRCSVFGVRSSVLTCRSFVRQILFYLSTYLIMWITLKWYYNVVSLKGVQPIKTVWLHLLLFKSIFPFVRNQIECAINDFMWWKNNNKIFAYVNVCPSTTWQLTTKWVCIEILKYR